MLKGYGFILLALAIMSFLVIQSSGAQEKDCKNENEVCKKDENSCCPGHACMPSKHDPSKACHCYKLTNGRYLVSIGESTQEISDAGAPQKEKGRKEEYDEEVEIY